MKKTPFQVLLDKCLDENPWTPETVKWLRKHRDEMAQISDMTILTARHMYAKHYGEERAQHVCPVPFDPSTKMDDERREFFLPVMKRLVEVVNDPAQRYLVLQAWSSN